EWMSEEGAVRLAVESTRVSSGLLLRGNRALEELVGQVRALLRDGSLDLEPALRALGVLRRYERLSLRWFGEGGRQRGLGACVSPRSGVPGEVDRARPLPGLSPTESKVATLAADGHSVLNISLQLGVREATVRTHLRRLYVKLGVHGRAELASVLL